MILIDNRLQVAKIRLGYIVSLTMAVVFFIFTFSTVVDTRISWVAVVITLACFVFMLLMKPEYVYIQVKNSKKLIIRTYHAFPMFRKYKSYEVSLSNFVRIESKKNVFSSKPFIRFIVKSKKSEGSYPWLSFSVVPKQDYNRFRTYFNKNFNQKL